jgi:hypothetical protein
MKILPDTEAARRAREFGIDLTLLEQNLNLTPTERLRKLEQRVGRISRLREGLSGTGSRDTH